jgi:hypothetical protein
LGPTRVATAIGFGGRSLCRAASDGSAFTILAETSSTSAVRITTFFVGPTATGAMTTGASIVPLADALPVLDGPLLVDSPFGRASLMIEACWVGLRGGGIGGGPPGDVARAWGGTGGRPLGDFARGSGEGALGNLPPSGELGGLVRVAGELGDFPRIWGDGDSPGDRGAGSSLNSTRAASSALRSCEPGGGGGMVLALRHDASAGGSGAADTSLSTVHPSASSAIRPFVASPSRRRFRSSSGTDGR